MTKILNNEKFAHNIQEIRHSCKLSQDETVRRLHKLGSPLSRSTYSLIELGKGNLYVSDLVGLQKVFQVDFSAFFEGISIAR